MAASHEVLKPPPDEDWPHYCNVCTSCLDVVPIFSLPSSHPQQDSDDNEKWCKLVIADALKSPNLLKQLFPDAPNLSGEQLEDWLYTRTGVSRGHPGVIIAVVVACIFLLLLICGVICYCSKKDGASSGGGGQIKPASGKKSQAKSSSSKKQTKSSDVKSKVVASSAAQAKSSVDQANQSKSNANSNA